MGMQFFFLMNQIFCLVNLVQLRKVTMAILILNITIYFREKLKIKPIH